MQIKEIVNYIETPNFWDANKELPFFVEAVNEENSEMLANFMISNRKNIEKKCNQYGAILFRGFGVDSEINFQGLAEKFLNKPISYLKGDTPRNKIGNNFFNTER